MRLARKLAFALMLGIFAVMAAYAYFQVRNEVSLFENDLTAAARRGEAALVTLRATWRDQGEQRTHELVDEIAATLGDVETRWVRPDASGDDGPSVRLTADERAALARGDVLRLVRATDAGELRRYVFAAMAVGDPTVLEASESLRRAQTFVRMNHGAILLATVLIALICGLIAIGLGVRLVGQPVREIAEQARRMGMGDFSRRLAVRQNDEIGELAEEMNRLSGRLVAARDEVAAATDARIAALEQLRHADRLATVGQLASGVAHELGTPLSIVSARAGLLRAGDAPQPEVVESAGIIVDQTARMTAIIRQLLDLSRRRGPQLAVADLRPVVTRTAGLLSSLARSRDVVLDVVAPAQPLCAEIDESQVQQALANVIVNAIQATPKGRRVSVRLHACRARPPADRDVADGDYVCISVEDEGTGIATEHLPRLFQPFFTTKDVGEGTGLGLSVTEGIVGDHHGWIAVASVPGQGSRFDVYLPRVAAAAPADAARPV